MKTRLARSALFIASLTLAGSAAADGTEVDALTARIVELERIMEQLLTEREQTQRELRAVEADAAQQREQLATLSERPAPMPEPKSDAPSFRYGGYVKTDAIYSNYTDGDLPSTSLGRDFYVPGLVPVGGTGESTDFDSHARESRLFFRTDHTLDSGLAVRSYIEMDFLVTTEGNERVSNSYVPRMRHAYVATDNWLIGQTWSTFQNVGALAENLDFVGPAEGTVFERQPMVRYTRGPWQLALENRETTITPFGGGARITTDDGGLPDFVVRYTHSGDWGNLVLAGIVRDLSYEDDASNIDDSEMSYGLSVSGKFNVGERDDFRWMLSGGSGMGRYMGLNTANGAVINANNELEAIDSVGGFVSYRHFWSPRWRSNATLSFLSIDNDQALTGAGVTEESRSLHLNLIYSASSKLDVGVEFLHAERELAGGLDGELNRLQFSTVYKF